MAYVNLPGTYPTLLDGNLRQFVPNADPITLVIGTANSGFTGELYAVNDVNAALVEFGRASELGRGLVEARDGGSTNVFLMRLAGLAPVLERVGSEHSSAAAGDTGFTITPTLASTESAERYGIAYRHARNYAASGSGAADTHEVVGELCIVDLETEELVWYGDITGRAFEDLGLMDIAVDDVYDGSSTTVAEEFSIAFTNAAAVAGTATFVIGGKTLEVVLAGGEAEAAQAAALRALVDADVDLACFTTALATTTVPNDTLVITADGITNADGELVYPSTHSTRAGLLARPFLEDFAAGTTTVSYTIAAATGHTLTVDVGQFPAEGLFPFNVTGGGVFVAFEDVVTAMQTIQDAMAGSASTMTLQAVFTDGDTGQEVSLMERYQKFHEAFTLLDFRDFDIILPQGVALDALNVEDGATAPTLTYDLQGEDTEPNISGLGAPSVGDAYRVSGGLDGSLGLAPAAAVGDVVRWDGAAWQRVTGDSIFPIPGSTADVMGEVAIVENADYTFTYYWDTDGDGIANISSDGTFSSNAATAASLTYHEVNFAHQLASFCFQASEDFQFCHGVIGTSLPTSLSPRGIRNFFGRLPTYTYDSGLQTDVVASSADNGTGLLGHKLVGGQNGYHFNTKNGGIPLTRDGYFDTSNSSANIVEDANGEEVDLGKYISVVAAFGHLRNEFNDRTGGYLTNLANVYGGMITSLPENESTTAQRMPAVQMNYYMPAGIADDAAGARIIVLINDEGSPTVADGPTFALLTSDYTRLTTMRIVAKVVEEFRRASRPFLGKGMSTGRRLAHETALQAIIQKNIADDETITGGSFTVSQTRGQRVQGKMDVDLVLTPVFELRQILLRVSLSA